MLSISIGEAAKKKNALARGEEEFLSNPRCKVFFRVPRARDFSGSPPNRELVRGIRLQNSPSFCVFK